MGETRERPAVGAWETYVEISGRKHRATCHNQVERKGSKKYTSQGKERAEERAEGREGGLGGGGAVNGVFVIAGPAKCTSPSEGEVQDCLAVTYMQVAI